MYINYIPEFPKPHPQDKAILNFKDAGADTAEGVWDLVA